MYSTNPQAIPAMKKYTGFSFFNAYARHAIKTEAVPSMRLQSKPNLADMIK